MKPSITTVIPGISLLRSITWYSIQDTRFLFNIHILFKQGFFSAHPQCCLNFSWIELKMLRRCCLIHMSIIIMRHFLFLLYLYPFLVLHLFMSYLCDPSFMFIFIFIMISHIISWISHLFFRLFSRICLIIFASNKFSLRVLLNICLIFCQF